MVDRVRLKWSTLLVYVAGVIATGALGAMASLQAPAFYLSLARPTWAPPSWLFGPVWTLLYALMAVAAWLVSASEVSSRNRALVLWWAQLPVNASWTWLFFTQRSGVAALADIVLLLALVTLLVVVFWRIRPLAGVMLVPYVAWVGYATALTIAVWKLNPAVL